MNTTANRTISIVSAVLYGFCCLACNAAMLVGHDWTSLLWLAPTFWFAWKFGSNIGQAVTGEVLDGE